MTKPLVWLARLLSRLDALFGRGLVVSIGASVILSLALGAAAFAYFNTAAPRTVTIASGPAGSSFQRNAERYKEILARDGVTLRIVQTEGSHDNLRLLTDTTTQVDVGFVLGGEAKDIEKERKYDHLAALGTIAYQPIMVFYTGEQRTLLSDFKGKRINIGPEGSGTHAIGLALLKANGIMPGDAIQIDQTDLADPGKDLREGRVDAVFLMSDSTAVSVVRELMRDEQVRLLSFLQADGYVRRMKVLNKLILPRGTLDFGRDIPDQDVLLVGPTVQLVARNTLHPALSDLLLDAAREVHGGAGLYRKAGEFPRAQDGDFRVSTDAQRFYASGKSFLYRTFPFWLASLIARTLALLVPLVVLLLPALRFAPMVYRWKIESRIYRWYRALLDVERDAFKPGARTERREELLAKLDHIEAAVKRIVVPASFGDLFYGLRSDIEFVRQRLRQVDVDTIHTAPPI